MRFILNLLFSAAAVFATAYILPGVRVDSLVTAALVAVILGIVNAIIRPILLFLTLPLNIITLGLFTFVINALMVVLVDALIPGFEVDGFLWALAFSIILSLISSILYSLIKR